MLQYNSFYSFKFVGFISYNLNYLEYKLIYEDLGWLMVYRDMFSLIFIWVHRGSRDKICKTHWLKLLKFYIV